jgi:3-phenylpropionate/trans-cinnamate dioxygenase ferredoxin reductase component
MPWRSELRISRLVIVGASLAGLRVAQAARKAGFDCELVMLGEERHLPYTRPPLSKELLAGEHSVDRVGLPCDTLDAEWRLGVPAASLDRGRRRVVLADGEEVAYDRLILATGSRPRHGGRASVVSSTGFMCFATSRTRLL